eukprot:2875290-Rhodomonas_salina.1
MRLVFGPLLFCREKPAGKDRVTCLNLSTFEAALSNYSPLEFFCCSSRLVQQIGHLWGGDVGHAAGIGLVFGRRCRRRHRVSAHSRRQLTHAPQPSTSTSQVVTKTKLKADLLVGSTENTEIGVSVYQHTPGASRTQEEERGLFDAVTGLFCVQIKTHFNGSGNGSCNKFNVLTNCCFKYHNYPPTEENFL